MASAEVLPSSVVQAGIQDRVLLRARLASARLVRLSVCWMPVVDDAADMALPVGEVSRAEVADSFPAVIVVVVEEEQAVVAEDVDRSCAFELKIDGVVVEQAVAREDAGRW